MPLNPSLQLPEENEFIPTDFTIRERPHDVSTVGYMAFQPWNFLSMPSLFELHVYSTQFKDDFQSVLRTLRTLMFVNIINGSLDGIQIDVIR